MTLEGKAVLITGAARRVGRALACALAARGARLAIHYRSSRADALGLASQLRRAFGTTIVLVRADLEKIPEIERLARAAAAALGGLDVLINSASLYERTPFGSVSAKDWDRHLNANLRAPFFLSQAVAPYLKKSGRGHIVNIADWSAHRPYADYAPYCASKAGLLCLNKALAKALAPKVQVNAVLPGPVLLPEKTSPGLRRAVTQATLLKRLGSPADVVDAVLFLLERGDFTTGAELTVDGGRLIA